MKLRDDYGGWLSIIILFIIRTEYTEYIYVSLMIFGPSYNVLFVRARFGRLKDVIGEAATATATRVNCLTAIHLAGQPHSQIFTTQHQRPNYHGCTILRDTTGEKSYSYT